MERNFDNRLNCCWQSTAIFCSNSEKNLQKKFVQRKISQLNSSGHRDAFLINMPKNDKKLKICWTFEKIYLLKKFSEKHDFPQKVPLEALSPVLITLLKIFRQKFVFSTKFKKNSPPSRPLFWKKVSNWTILQDFFPGEAYMDR